MNFDTDNVCLRFTKDRLTCWFKVHRAISAVWRFWIMEFYFAKCHIKNKVRKSTTPSADVTVLMLLQNINKINPVLQCPGTPPPFKKPNIMRALSMSMSLLLSVSCHKNFPPSQVRAVSTAITGAANSSAKSLQQTTFPATKDASAQSKVVWHWSSANRCQINTMSLKFTSMNLIQEELGVVVCGAKDKKEL